MAIDHDLDSAHDGPFGLHASRDGATLHVALTGEFDVAAVTAVEDAVARAFDGDTATLVLDLSRLTFIDSSGLRVVMETRDRSAEHGVGLQLVRGIPAVHRVFEITGLADVLPFGDGS